MPRNSKRPLGTRPNQNYMEESLVSLSEMDPGRTTQFGENCEALISALKKSASNWKWPSTPDQLPYSKDKIIQEIHEPEQIGRREIFKVKELQVYSDL